MAIKNENHELNLLSSISKTLIENTDPKETIQQLERSFNQYGRASKKFMELSNVNIYLYDENTKLLKDFSKSWIVLERNVSVYNEKLYLVITQFSQFEFFVNGSPYKLEDLETPFKIKVSETNNSVLFPFKKNEKPFGMLELTFPNRINNLISFDFFMMLSVISYQVSLKIQNTILTDQMQMNIDFYASMKNIAKIIETQYELNYIIPIIGEMIDRFVSNHLVYVFLRDEQSNNLNLVWPNACRDEQVFEIVKTLNQDSKISLLNNGKVGVFPLIGKKLLGCIVAHSNNTKLSRKEVEYLEQLSRQSSITLQRASAYAEVLQHATLDALTGLNNRRQFEVRLSQEVASAKRQNRPLCAIMVDIDFFKKVNDTYGHIAGDTVLKNIASVIKASLRESDIPSRYGGEEFAILLPDTKIPEGLAVAERLRKSVEAATIPIKNDVSGASIDLKVTISVGINEYEDGNTGEELYKKADKALYKAKTTGRNRVIECTPALMAEA